MSTTSSHAPLPRATLDYIINGAPPGRRNQALFDAATQYRDAGYTFEEAESILIGRALADGLSGPEAYQTLKSACSKEPRDPVGNSSDGPDGSHESHSGPGERTKSAGEAPRPGSKDADPNPLPKPIH